MDGYVGYERYGSEVQGDETLRQAHLMFVPSGSANVGSCNVCKRFDSCIVGSGICFLPAWVCLLELLCFCLAWLGLIRLPVVLGFALGCCGFVTQASLNHWYVSLLTAWFVGHSVDQVVTQICGLRTASMEQEMLTPHRSLPAPARVALVLV